MAIHHPATITPGKLELLQAWVPHQPWAVGADTSALTRLGSYRFDDPDGEVGIETHLLAGADGQVLQVPLTYRGAPREGGEQSLVTTMTHTTLGDRWVYDACHDPVYVDVLTAVILTGGCQADLFAVTEDGLVQEVTTTWVRGSGSTPQAQVPSMAEFAVHRDHNTTRLQGSLCVSVLHRPSQAPAGQAADRAGLTGTWPGQQVPLLLATVEPAA